ncbi:P-loop containing nucleoside triphosphate hydrolase protein [Aspergillus varians]
MRPWTNRGSHGLLGALRASSRPPLTRAFTTTPAFQRSKRSKKEERLETRKAKSAKLDASTHINSKSSSMSSRIRRQTMIATDFPSVIISMLKEMKDHESFPSEVEIASWKRFERFILNACKAGDRGTSGTQGSLHQIRHTLRRAYIRSGAGGLRREMEYFLYAHHLNAKFSEPNLEQQKKIADMRYPAEWYPQARATQRTIHLHVGPTNSGKTYHALKQLEASKSGFYAGPLRLLAQEVYHRFHTSGIPCSLVTGDEVKAPEGQKSVIVSNTVEMVNLGQRYDVGVIDEIQMIADPKRGWAWTRALLGSRATELHLCGEVRAVPLIRELAALTGDKLEIHRYERLNPLKAADRSLQGDLKRLQKGDCVVSFSRVGIHALKADIEKVTGRRAAIIYGSLPAEIRTQQASLFNDPDNDYDFLVASDAIGMGLNLSCKRIIFETVVKNLPTGLTRLSVSEIKQIGGRAGRYRAAVQHKDDRKNRQQDETNVGYVTSLEEVDLPYIRNALGTDPPPLTAAGIQPPDSAYEKFAAYYPQSVSLEYMVKRLAEICQTNPLFFMCDPDHPLANAEVIDAVPGVPLIDQLTFMAAPIHAREESGRNVAMDFVSCVANHTNGRLLDIENINLEILEEPVSANKYYMQELESLHRAVILYTWLSYRFGGVFTDRTLAVHVKQLVEERMVRALTEFSANKKLRKDASLRRQIALQKQVLEQQQFLNAGKELNNSSSELLSTDGLDASDTEESTEVDLGASDDDYEEEPAGGATPSNSKESSEIVPAARKNYEEEPAPRAATN